MFHHTSRADPVRMVFPTGEKHMIIFPGRPRSVWEVPFGLLAETLISEQRGWKLVRASVNLRCALWSLPCLSQSGDVPRAL